MNPIVTDTPDAILEQLLKRTDIWRGGSRALVSQAAVDTGYAEVNAVLHNGGWPTGNLVEVCQKGHHQQEWFLFSPVLKTGAGYIVLLNPPGIPFCQALIQSGIDLERVIVVQVTNKADFLASFVELARTESCEVLLAWQPQQALSYTELRKCLLATNEGAGLRVLFRPDRAQQQSSPAILRLLTEITPADIHIKIFKQKGVLPQHQAKPIRLALPEVWKGLLPYSLLDQTILPGATASKRTSATIMPLRGDKR